VWCVSEGSPPPYIGVWGVTPGDRFTEPSSTPHTALLALMVVSMSKWG
jgi:hypothetical protein